MSDSKIALIASLYQNSKCFDPTPLEKAVKVVLLATYRKYGAQGLPALYDDVGGQVLEEMLDRLAESVIDKELKRTDKFWAEAGSASVGQKKHHLIEVVVGNIKPTADPSKAIKDCLKSLKVQKTVAELRGFRTSIDDDKLIEKSLSTMPLASLKTLSRKLDRENEVLQNGPKHTIVEHIMNLACEKLEPEAKIIAKKGPLKSAAMKAKWDGVDRD